MLYPPYLSQLTRQGSVAGHCTPYWGADPGANHVMYTKFMMIGQDT